MKKKRHRHIFYFALVSSLAVLNLFPYRIAAGIGGRLGRWAFFLAGRERKKTLEHLRFAFGNEKSEKEIYAIAQALFEHYGRMAVEIGFVHKILPCFDDWVSIEGREHIEEALKKGNGIIGIVAHFGAWELMGGYLASLGYPVTVIARKIYFEKYDRLLVSIRKKMKVNTIYRDDSPRKMLKVPKDNGLLVFVGDQDVDSVDGVFVDFFGKPAYTPIAPVRFAMTTGAPLIPGFLVRDGIKHRLVIEKSIDFTVTGNKESDLQTNTQKWVGLQEKYIRQYPHLWVWNHKRWKTKKLD